MKKQKIALGKLALNKERIIDLDKVLGGGPVTLISPCHVVTLQVNCQQTVICPTRPVMCQVTRTPACVITIGNGCPPQSLACTQSLAC